jgi:RecA/RadA recombinase
VVKKKAETKPPTKLSDLKEETYLSTGIAELDEMITGFARGRITEIWGNPGIGKSYLLAKTLASLDGTALYVDAEYSLVKQRLADLGVKLDKVDYIQDGRLEQVTERILEAVGAFDLIILDSLAKLIPMTVETSEVGTNAIGLFARQVKHFEAKLKPILATSKTAFVVINQARAGMGAMAPAKPQGGFAWEHAIDIRIKLSKPLGSKQEHVIKGQKVFTGHLVEATVEKSRLTPPYIKTKFLINYRKDT